MTEDERRKYAEFLILAHTEDIEWLSYFEMYDQFAGEGSEISEADAHLVDALVNRAIVTVSWPDEPQPRHSNVITGSVAGTVVQTGNAGSINLGGVR